MVDLSNDQENDQYKEKFLRWIVNISNISNIVT